MKPKEIIYGLHAIESSMISPPKVEHTLTDPAIAGLRTLLPSVTKRFHVLEAGTTFSKALT